jgi:hypothetical protein
MDSLKAKWNELDTPWKWIVGTVAALVSVVVVLKVLPALIGAMGVAAFIAILVLPYWIPTIVAFARKHPSKGAVLALNFFLGWTFIGWVVSLIWALSDNTARGGAMQTVVVNNHVHAAAAVQPQPIYQVGDVVNGHRFDGAGWTPVQAPPTAAAIPAPPAASPVMGSVVEDGTHA